MKLWIKNLRKKVCVLSLLSAGILIAFSAGWAYADELPKFRRGMWEFNRTMESAEIPGKPQTITHKKCTDPTEDMKKQNEMLLKAGCKFSPLSRTGNTYSFTSECNIQGVEVQGKSVITVENYNAYTIHIESRQGKQVVKEMLKARRTGDCPN